MARPTEHDREKVLEKAMEVFWNKGYMATSMPDLIEATGLTSRSMYNVFESKNGLFKAALKKYFELRLSKALMALDSKEGVDGLVEYFKCLGLKSSVKIINGCFFCNTISDKNAIESDSYKIVEDYFLNLEKKFFEKLEFARKYQGFRGDSKIRAKQLIVINLGLGLYSKMDKSQEYMRILIPDLLASFGIFVE